MDYVDEIDPCSLEYNIRRRVGMWYYAGMFRTVGTQTEDSDTEELETEDSDAEELEIGEPETDTPETKEPEPETSKAEDPEAKKPKLEEASPTGSHWANLSLAHLLYTD
jgi:hypothetical protein